MLTRRYPLHHARDSTHDEVAEKLRRMERYEIALQGDDYADKEAQKTNHEALAYARAAASVASITRFKLSELCAGDRQEALQQLKREPYISDFRARQIVDLVRSGTCQALSAFEDNKAPVGSDGRVRLHNEGGRSMSGARSKRELSKVLGISATRAGELWDGIHRDLPRIESMPRLCHAKRQEVGGVYAHRKPLQAANAESTHGYENLSMDYHDKVFGVWRTAEGRHRRIDLVVCSYPEEIALARLTWIGGRQLNRFMRGYCLSNGLWLSAHALLVKNAGEPLVIRDQQSGQVVTIPAPGEPTPAIVPYKYLRTERHVLYLLGGGTDEFFGLLDARNRNA